MQSLGYEDIQERTGTPGNPGSGFLRMFADSTGRIKYVDAAGNVTDLIPAIQQEKYVFAADTGAANAYAVTLTPTPTIVAGSEVVFKAANANTGASTLAINGGAATAITKNGTTALSGSEISAGQIITAKYDGTNWQIVAPSTSGSGGGANISAIQQELYVAADDTGSANAYAVTLSPAPTIVKYSEAVFKVGHTNTGAVTLSVNGATAAPVKKKDGVTDLVAGDWTAGQIVQLIFDGTNWQWTGGSGTSTPGTTASASYVQGAADYSNKASGGGSLSFTSNNSAGNCLIVIAHNGGGNTIGSVSDSQANTYTQIGSTLSINGDTMSLWVAPNCKAGANTVSISGGYVNLIIAEYSGVATASALDAYNSATVGTGPINMTLSVTTTVSSDLLLFIAGAQGALTQAGSSYTQRQGNGGTYGGTPRYMYLWDALASAPGTYSDTASGPGSYGNALGFIIALKPGTTLATGPITALTGDVVANGPGSVPATLASTGVAPGSYTSANITVDAKGRVIAASNGGGIYFGQGDAAAAAGNNLITLGSTPVAGSISVYVGGSVLRPSTDYTVSAAVITLTTALTVGQIVVVNWATQTSSPGGISLGTSGFAPATGMSVWFKADAISGVSSGSNLTTWADSSGNGNTATVAAGSAQYTTGQINTLPAVTLSNCKLNLATAIASSAGHTAFVVIRNISTGGKGTIFSGASSCFNWWTCNGGKQQGADKATVSQLGTGTAANNTSWQQMNVAMNNNSAGFSLSFRLARAADATLSSSAADCTASNSAIGYNAGNNSEFLNAQIAELLYYPTLLTLTQIQATEAYLQNKYGI